jgi:translation initiation factor 6
MPFLQTNFNGESYLGLFGFATDSYCLISNRLSEQKYARLEETLGVKIIPSTVFSFGLSGIMSAGNSNGVLLPYLASESEIEKIGEAVGTVSTVPDKFTALGNLIVANDSGGIISDAFSEDAKRIIDDVLGFETVQRSIAGSSEVGSVCLATNKGFVVTPDCGVRELEELRRIFGVDGGKASANMGSRVVGASIIANSNGYVIGEETSGIELGYIEEALGF